MSASDAPETTEEEARNTVGDSRADTIVIGIILVTLVLFALHFVSGWTFDL